MCIRKAVIRLKSFSYYKVPNSNYSITSLLVWGDSLAIKGNILLVLKFILGISCPGIFRLLLVAHWVPARKLLEVNRVYTAWNSVYRAVDTWAAYT